MQYQNHFNEVKVSGKIITEGITAEELETYIRENILTDYRWGLCAQCDGNTFEPEHEYEDFFLEDFEEMLRKISDFVKSGTVYIQSDDLTLYKRYKFQHPIKTWMVANGKIKFVPEVYALPPMPKK